MARTKQRPYSLFKNLGMKVAQSKRLLHVMKECQMARKCTDEAHEKKYHDGNIGCGVKFPKSLKSGQRWRKNQKLGIY
ncbi:MAG: hypothetical protein ACXW1B_03680 [Nitrososphaeraceae archaeon]